MHLETHIELSKEELKFMLNECEICYDNRNGDEEEKAQQQAASKKGLASQSVEMIFS